MISGDDQVILFLADDRFDAVQKWDEEIIMQIIE